MKFKYGKFVPSLADEVDMEELVSWVTLPAVSPEARAPGPEPR